MFLNSFMIFLLAFLPSTFAINFPSCLTLYDLTSKKSVPTYTETFKFTTTSTASVVYVTKTITLGTSTVPTSPGFTPVLSETSTASYGFPACLPSSTTSTTSAHKGLPSLYPDYVFCTTLSTLTITKTATKGVSVSTATTTDVVPSATFYAACAANNIVDQGEGAGYNHAIAFETYGCGNGNYNFSRIANSTAYDCCVACQITPLCSWSSLDTYYGFMPPVAPYCTLAVQEQGICDGSMSNGPSKYYYDGGSSATAGEGFIVSNGPCGQILYGGTPAG